MNMSRGLMQYQWELRKKKRAGDTTIEICECGLYFTAKFHNFSSGKGYEKEKCYSCLKPKPVVKVDPFSEHREFIDMMLKRNNLTSGFCSG